jgi:endonuclease/exonuclease/phosphatase family metal-dependent hydrolase
MYGPADRRGDVTEPGDQPTWIAPASRRELAQLAAWCNTVGPVVVETPPVAPGPPVDRLAIITWNTHVGGGDLAALVGELRRGRFTGGVRVSRFVLLLQEVYRRGIEVPRVVPVGAPVPRPIFERPPGGTRRDIRDAARALDLAFVYVPSMRNSGPIADALAEDRGNAILSTEPLRAIVLIELPLEHQRRVAVAATLGGETTRGTAWQLCVVAAHLDTGLALARGGPFAARRRQARALVDALSEVACSSLPAVLGGDFNTWAGDDEPAIRDLRRAFPMTPRPRLLPTWAGPLGARATLDHVFVRIARGVSSTNRLPHRFGSDHYPLLTVVSF